MRTFTDWLRSAAGVATLALVVGACSGDFAESPLSPDAAANTTAPGASTVRLAKIGPAGTTATFEITATGGQLPLGPTITIDSCPEGTPCFPVLVWRPTDASGVQVTIEEVAHTGNLYLERINVIGDLDGIVNILDPEDPSVTVNVNDTNGALVRFKNIELPGAEGCTPGFWRQDQHFEYWTAPYTPGTFFGDVFADAFPGQTLLDVVWLGGGELNALGRHSVAALLNATSPDVDYGMTPGEVIDAFNAAFASGEYEAQKDVFEAANEQGCTATGELDD